MPNTQLTTDDRLLTTVFPTGLQYLRARYYDTGFGRFISRDTWAGEYNDPLSLNRWAYVQGNPVNYVDPSGHYHKEVHLELTESLVRRVDPRLGPLVNNALAYVISRADQAVDETNGLMPIPYEIFGQCIGCHFMSWDSTISHVEEAIRSRNPYLFGSTLHQLQDYFAHWGEGYRPQLGHGVHSVLEKTRSRYHYSEFFLGGSYLSYGGILKWVESPMGHTREEVIQDIRTRNPGFDPSNLSDDELMNLYLRRDPEFSGADERFEERDYYGIDPDMYLPRTRRDTLMEQTVRDYMQRFFDEMEGDACNIDWTIPETSEIRDLLTR